MTNSKPQAPAQKYREFWIIKAWPEQNDSTLIACESMDEIEDDYQATNVHVVEHAALESLQAQLEIAMNTLHTLDYNSEMFSNDDEREQLIQDNWSLVILALESIAKLRSKSEAK